MAASKSKSTGAPAPTPARSSVASCTIWDVARLAEVSAMTVSRVINGGSGVKLATREKVESAIDQLGYRVNMAARAARVGTLRVGLLYSNPSAAFLSAFLVGAMTQCTRSGAEMVLEVCQDRESQAKAIDRLIAHGADGVLVPPPLCDSPAALKRLMDIGMPTVAVATGKPAPGVSAVRIDDYDGAKAMTEYLLSLGHRDIGFIQGDPKHTPAQLRFQAFKDTLKAAGLVVPERRIVQGLFTYRSGLEAARLLLAHKSRPTAIFAANDDMAAAAVAVAHGLQLRVPEDVAIAGFDDTPVATTVWPELTTIHQPIGELGRVAVELVVAQARAMRSGEAFAPRHTVMPYRLQTRGSTVAVPTV